MFNILPKQPAKSYTGDCALHMTAQDATEHERSFSKTSYKEVISQILTFKNKTVIELENVQVAVLLHLSLGLHKPPHLHLLHRHNHTNPHPHQHQFH